MKQYLNYSKICILSRSYLHEILLIIILLTLYQAHICIIPVMFNTDKGTNKVESNMADILH